MPTKEDYYRYRDYYKKQALERYYRNREKILPRLRQKKKEKYATDTEYRKNELAKCADYHRRMAKLWRADTQQGDRKLFHEAEKLVANVILPKEGFMSIIPTSHNIVWSYTFPFFDILCKKNGSKCAVDVTTGYFWQIKRRESLATLLDFFALRFFVCFVRPNLKEYILLELKREKIPSGLLISERKLKLLKTI